MNQQDISSAAALLWQHFRETTRLAQLPASWRPRDRIEGYAVQAEVARVSRERIAGWKIAATSKAGQRHIHVDGPIAGPLFGARQREGGATVSLAGSNMNVAEAEFAFRMAADLPPRPESYTVAEVMAAVATLHCAIEVPDSRYEDFTRVGAAQLIADVACACWFSLGPPVRADWRSVDLAQHVVRMHRGGAVAGEGSGANVLGDPRIALAWIANELSTFGTGLRAGEVVMTGTCLAPVAVGPGDRVRADFGAFGAIEAAFA